MFGKRVYSAALTRALRENGALTDTDWPDDLATPEEAATWWAFRVTPPRYPDLPDRTPDLKVLLLFSRDDHVQPSLDKPHIHQAYDGFHHTAGLWTRLNPDAAYLPAAQFPGYQDHPANNEPGDWKDARDWGYPPVNVGPKLAPQSAVAEMADRTHEDNWAPDLNEPLYSLVVTARKGFILVHCDPQEILSLHENYDPATFDYDGNGHYDAEDAWQALMDLVDLADSYGIPLTLQFSPPYVDFMRQPRCDNLLGEGRVYPQDGDGVPYTRCLDLVMAWGANGHELSLHHHGPLHDPLTYCSNHGDEIPDMPSDPHIIYTTQGTGYTSDPASYPKCIGYDVEREYHTAPKFTWFYSHGPVFNHSNLDAVKTTLQEMLSDKAGHVLGLVFHVNDFLRSEINPDDPRYHHLIRDLFTHLSTPDDGGGPVQIKSLSDLMVEAGKTEAPDPCVEACFTLDESSDQASYTIPVPPPPNCGAQAGTKVYLPVVLSGR